MIWVSSQALVAHGAGKRPQGPELRMRLAGGPGGGSTSAGSPVAAALGAGLRGCAGFPAEVPQLRGFDTERASGPGSCFQALRERWLCPRPRPAEGRELVRLRALGRGRGSLRAQDAVR